ncbi:MAG: hypothetical protein A2836_00285 [Candidatus Taylorbacteria bacterium RIFCSPHIGHO2_01_FULL_45_63]|uniref:Uncharacterized protein n=1 Tax=Candidatus Taylorbacteria bacterium RIFCSPHIGHO2_02_FULL_45_35 TaxID=1802311 RepID=A0A1G2MVH3_9BACT|nr:MAG: hypothetical protein A2836_00285 [Candidatus Taylorbacteria bacterium RIFCSPHIGHO2_01_FULL_45_63]OHA27866.1 MAG: hypothetical protein A3D56_01455 [Candidatus Taylorbacteria bacterium RIFCSPHIGHO2_02_FULL_45_35]OHA32428.1 MAG: hypothetical protein A3A22_01020 [Candidatus Taylorbacteria bacterium RIFCSPLOWO2_01_FULL_45_34b]
MKTTTNCNLTFEQIGIGGKFVSYVEEDDEDPVVFKKTTPRQAVAETGQVVEFGRVDSIFPYTPALLQKCA